MKWLKRISPKKNHSLKLNSPSQKLGALYEERAKKYLLQQGYKLVEANYRCNLGEIDLIFTHDNVYIFIEVKFRRNSAFGSAIESVTKQKQKKIIKAAEFYLLTNGLSSVDCRF
ncbi:MAG: YraN family protein, partial [Kangiellaceae bacterium]|nr:YraN family protein [Kangiellaceae bacterium]